MRVFVTLAVLLFGVGLSQTGFAHKSNIGLLDIREKSVAGSAVAGKEAAEPFVYTLNWSFTGVSMETFPTPKMPAGCERITPNRQTQKGSGVSGIYTMQCVESLFGHQFRFAGDAHRMDQLVLLYEGAAGKVEKFYTSKNMAPVIRQSDFSSDEKAASAPVSAGGFFSIGFEHMILGWDHLLFLFCLLFLTGINRRLVLTVTGFTVGHSITLLLAARDVISLPSTPVEILIALSIVYMASEAIRSRTGLQSLFSRYPMVIAVSFGLLHGLGFSSALEQLALSEDMSLMALLLFNLGIEAAQLLVVAAIAAIVMVAGRLPLQPGVWKPRAGAAGYALTYCMGIIAGYWFVERTVAML